MLNYISFYHLCVKMSVLKFPSCFTSQSLEDLVLLLVK